jgi:hypothetical protein
MQNLRQRDASVGWAAGAAGVVAVPVAARVRSEAAGAYALRGRPDRLYSVTFFIFGLPGSLADKPGAG